MEGEENDENVSPERVNPFERFLLRNLKGSVVSPTIFKEDNNGDLADSVLISSDSDNPQGEGDRRGRGALLTLSPDLLPFRRDLEESPSSHTNPYPTGDEEEARAQEDILSFFSQGKIAPTPDDVQRQKVYFVGGLLGTGTGGDEEKGQRKGTVTTSSSWTNTMLSLPPILPPEVEDMLKQYFTVSECSQTEKGEESVPASMDEDEILPEFSVRRRLNLSFGEYDSPLSGTPIKSLPAGDPFSDNHVIATPTRGDEGALLLLTPATELEVRFRRCEFTPGPASESCSNTPNTSGGNVRMRTPNITPIRSDRRVIAPLRSSSSSAGDSSPLSIPTKRRRIELAQDCKWDLQCEMYDFEGP